MLGGCRPNFRSYIEIRRFWCDFEGGSEEQMMAVAKPVFDPTRAVIVRMLPE
jgi:hypothetical protein